MSLILYEAIFLLTLCLKVTVAELPSSCLTSLTSSDSVQCCQTSPFLEISFKLRFGCDVPETLEQGIRLEIRKTPSSNWQPVRFYTPSFNETNSSIVRLLGNNMVTAEALQYSSNFSRQFVEGNRQFQFREYICDPAFLVDGVSVRWMQRFMAISRYGVGTWSLDDITLTVWNGLCRHVVLRNNFDAKNMSSMYQTQAGNVTNLSCDTTNNQQLYFRKEAFRMETSRRSLTISDLPLDNTAALCPEEDITGAGSCNVSECGDGRSVCSIGSTQCDSCKAIGYRVPAEGTIGSCLDVNECAESNGNCEQTCVNKPGSYHCECRDGFNISDNGVSCVDFDECLVPGTNNCEQDCTNNDGSYNCSCFNGYTLLSNGFQCEDVDECSMVPNVCDQLCFNTNGSFQCGCMDGYMLDSDGRSCADINECLTTERGCEQGCNNTPGSFVCVCNRGYTLSPDGRNCTDINECESGVCGQFCRNTPGSYECSCMNGFDLAADRRTCDDIDECSSPLNNCDEMCFNTNGSYQCDCLPGFSLSPDSFSCRDIDECVSSDLNNCEDICINTNGSFQCNCSEGFSLLNNGFSCQDIDECASSEMNECNEIAMSLCRNTNGSYKCVCQSGFISVRNDSVCQGVEFGSLEEIRNALNNSNSTQIAKLLADLVSRLIKNGQLASREFSVLLTNIVDDFFGRVDTGGGENADQEAVSSVLNTLDQFALRVYDDREPKLETDGFQLMVTNGSSGRFEGISIGGNIITLPSDFGEGVKVASFFFKNLSNALPSGPGIDSEKMPVISSSVLCDNCDASNLNISDPVRYQLVVNKTDNNTQLDCVFYNLTSHAWSNESCTRNDELSNETVSVCECTHLTHFAILLSPGINTSEEIIRQLEIVSYVSVSISLFCLVLTILALTIVKSLWGMRNFIHVNLCGCLFIAQLLFVTTVDKTDNVVFCQSIAVVLHYAFLVTFMWMLMEGVVLYVVLVQVFVKRPKLYMAFFALVSYGLPLLYLCLTVPLGFALRGSDGEPHYGSSDACWLRYDTGFVWAFIAPVILIILINIGFFIMSVYIMRKHTKRQSQKSRLTSIAQWLKSSVVLLICMGIPWIIGVAVFTETIALAFIFSIFVGLQGFIIFILFVPLSKQVREGYKKWWRGKLSESEFLSKHFSSSDLNHKSSILERLSSFKTSTLRGSKSGTYRSSRIDRSSHTDRSSHADDHDIKLPETSDNTPSQSPPPYEEYVVQSQKVVNVGNGSTPHVEKGEHIDGMSVSALQNGSSEHVKVDLSNGIENVERKSMFEEQRIKFTDSVPDVREYQIEGTSL
ncbi:adhesion G protein-coupled receptor E2-like isoform X3 [Halichondria panicea]|uniref:adhesion G protein-coupled receptor E2-like isoform X3 n=1 Tax=Halichondria panicea TaxID=6063 RepID=UPI00312B4DF2